MSIRIIFMENTLNLLQAGNFAAVNDPLQYLKSAAMGR
jgi:hypothetical protein